MEDLKVLVNPLRLKHVVVTIAEDGVEEGIENSLGGERPESRGVPFVLTQGLLSVESCFQVVHITLHSSVQVGPADRPSRVLDHLTGFPQDKAEDIPVYLFLDGIEIKVPFLAHRFKAVGVCDNGEVLVDKSDGEDFSIFGCSVVQEFYGMCSKVLGTSKDQAAFHYGRLSGASAKKNDNDLQ